MAFFKFAAFNFGGFDFRQFKIDLFEKIFGKPIKPLEPDPNIVEIAAGSEDFDLLVKALDTAGLTGTIQAAEDITVFAPTDAAFTQLAVDLGYQGETEDEDAVFDFLVGALTDLSPDGDPIPLLTDILLYHVSPGAQSAEEIDAADQIATLLEGASFGSEGTELIDNEPDIDNPNIVSPDIAAENGTIQGIDRVLLPIDIPGNEPEDPNIVEIAAGSEDFELLVKALDTAGLTGTIQAAEDITVFAPTDAAFTQLAVDLGYEGKVEDEDAVFDFLVGALTDLSPDGDPIPLLTDILLYHVSPGAQSAEEIDAAPSVETLLDGATFEADGTELVDNDPDIANPTIVAPDIAASNGTVQVIDRVLLPIDVPGEEEEEDILGMEDHPMPDGDAFDFFAFLPARVQDRLDDLPFFQDGGFSIPLRIFSDRDFGPRETRETRFESEEEFWF